MRLAPPQGRFWRDHGWEPGAARSGLRGGGGLGAGEVWATFGGGAALRSQAEARRTRGQADTLTDALGPLPPFRILFPGNNHMKEENYAAAVDCYTQAIELDPNNAVYYCNRAAAQSKLGHYTDAIKDCEKAIAIDSKYSKAYGRMGLALTAMNKFQEAVTSYQKALDLDPENDSYKSNLKIAEQKLREGSSPTGTGLSFDMASLINNPAFISMAASLMQNPQVQQLMSGMMTNAIGGPAAGVGGLTDLSSLIQAGQQFAQQIQQQNPELIEQLRNHIRSRSFSSSAEEHS
ncbi:small glutamine-rich tetratricopeptide repeat-containing protein beta isoform X3 [Cervus elaphus]|uniref:small glutamine-rich tetratricopeptide repeat-containing protein beta isoform X3 n=1 Tax=Cervus canadensis TaxID=1574408 RepID=UPI001C9E55E8|nr:small glutamine-rich tetratricopeptide repeat-containing protein beta isoform X3 [Cervus canadensis]XP_043743648.1 small glutamine-rich tetratricopeptide repeat-containing protein beta isoform X3 [Cervus elaphus]